MAFTVLTFAGNKTDSFQYRNLPEVEQKKIEYLKGKLYTHKEVDDWLTGRSFPMVKYDPELGWLGRNHSEKHGVDGARIFYNFGNLGQRRTIAYADRPCRVNTYGSSHATCVQVQDGETWQEILAAHLCEPLRNFGGFSVYQNYLRMKREEARTPAEAIVFVLYDDDYYRNSYSWVSFRFPKNAMHPSPTMPYLKVDWETRKITEVPNLCPTPESLYNLCDLDWCYEKFKDDLIMKLAMRRSNQMFEFMPEPETDYHKLAMLTSKYAIDRVAEFAEANNKKVLFVLSYHDINIVKRIRDNFRFDQEIVDHLNAKNLPYIDMMEAHVEDYAKYNLPLDDYLKIYYIGHYNPRGVFFYAFQIKDRLVEMLNPKPLPYRRYSE